MFDGLRKHIGVLRESWKAESERRKSKIKISEKDFLPAALEILEKPPSPLGRTFIWLLITFFTIAVVWAWFGRVDVVASAQGKVLPSERVKVIQAAEIGVVRNIFVRDGQKVKAGDVLIELDPTVSGAEEEQARRALQVAEVTAARTQAVLDHIDGKSATFKPPQGADDDMVRMQKLLINSQIGEYEASLTALNQQRGEAEADLAVVTGEIAKLEQTLPLIEDQVAARQELVDKGLNSRLTFLELQERLIGHKQNILIQQDQLGKVIAAIASIDGQIDQLRQEFRKNTIGEMAEAMDQITLQQEELKKASQRSGLQRLTAPVDGVVQQLVVYTIGGVVQPAEPLMVIVPGEGELIVEAQVLNKDIGFVEVGDEVEIKLEAFSFTKYGVIEGILEDLSTDAVQDENLGLVYVARISMAKDTIMANGREINLGPGMAATAEIKTGKRRLIEFVLSPLLRYRDEALRER